jgi:hypothetical protein
MVSFLCSLLIPYWTSLCVLRSRQSSLYETLLQCNTLSKHHHYKVLEVDSKIDYKELKKAYYSIVFIYHPDRKPEEQDKELGMYQYIYIYIYICVCIYIHIYVCMYVYICVHLPSGQEVGGMI